MNIEEKIKEAKTAYYNSDSPIMSDREYDNLIEKYGGEPSVGAPILNSLQRKAITDQPMLSLEKVHNEEEIIAFSQGWDMLASVKCDGVSVRLIYKKGNFYSANTRGDGFTGADITEHIKYFLNVPLKIPKVDEYIVDGEAIIYDKDFELINKNRQFKNNRNTTSGTLALLDMNIVKKRRLSFIAWDVIKGGGSDLFYHYNLEEAKGLGFTIAPSFTLDCQKYEYGEVLNINQNLLTIAKERGIPCDGVVWRINDLKEGKKRGQTAHHFKNAVAWKAYNERYKTELINIEWSIGRTGQITPIAVFNPIEIDGSVVEKASLHNVSVMKTVLGDCPYIGEPLEVAKMNMIIPQVIAANPKYNYEQAITNNKIPIEDIKKCPICNKEVVYKQSKDGVINVYCENSQCEGRLINKLNHFFGKKGLDIKGISKATFEKLIDLGWVNNIQDVFYLKDHKDEWIREAGFGEKSVTKILNTIEEGKHTSLEKFFTAMGIPLVGAAAAKILANEFDTYEDFKRAVANNDYSFVSFDGFGEEINNSIKLFDYAEIDSIVKFLSFEKREEKVIPQINTLINKTIVITGKLSQFKNRKEFTDAIEAAGGKVSSSVTKKTFVLVNNDLDSTTSKNKKAIELDIPILSEKEFIEKYLK